MVERKRLRFPYFLHVRGAHVVAVHVVLRLLYLKKRVVHISLASLALLEEADRHMHRSAAAADHCSLPARVSLVCTKPSCIVLARLQAGPTALSSPCWSLYKPP